MKNTANRDPKQRLIFALDVGSGSEEAISWVEILRDHVGLFKVGKEAFTSYGPEIVTRIQGMGGEVFLDLKFHDIPNTVARAAEAACRLGVFMFNIHALGGSKMMSETAAAVKNITEVNESRKPVVLAVTVLTSMGNDDLRELGLGLSTGELVVKLSRMAQDAGIDGVVASAQDVAAIRDVCGDEFIVVTPGIRTGKRPAGDDQKRILTPQDAIAGGADYLVVGRPIRMAADPVGEADRIVEDIRAGLDGRVTGISRES